MARNDGVDRTSVRNLAVSDKAVGNTQQHNEREKDSYRNPDIIPQRTSWNVHFKKPTASYTDLFAQLEAAGTISTRGLKPDATHYCELVFDVNSAYFDNHGGYEFAKQFYEDAYKAAVQIVGGEQYILSAVMHADELNTAMTEKYGKPVYHYHLHVMALPVVDKEIRWSKRCKDPEKIGTVKEVVHQVSHSKKWKSEKALDKNGQPVLNSKGKPVYRTSYSILQDQFFDHMATAGFADIQRGERGSTAEHLTVTEFKVAQEQKKLDALEAAANKKEAVLEKYDKRLKVQKTAALTFQEIDEMGSSSLIGKKISMTQDEAAKLKTLAKEGVTSRPKIIDLTRSLKQEKQASAFWKSRYDELREQTKDYIAAVKHAPEVVKNFLQEIMQKQMQEFNRRARERKNNREER